jgi:hypothetical protein
MSAAADRELFTDVISIDFLGFDFGTSNYTQMLKAQQAKTGKMCGVQCFVRPRPHLAQKATGITSLLRPPGGGTRRWARACGVGGEPVDRGAMPLARVCGLSFGP